MEADWGEVTRITTDVVSGPDGPTYCTFDDAQELLWVGHRSGRVASFHGPELRRYTSHKAADGPIQQILFHKAGVLSVSARSLHLSDRRGPAIWHLVDDQMIDLQCASFTSNPDHLLVAGFQPVMFLIDVEKGKIIRIVPTQNEYQMMKRNKNICAATQDGLIDFLDPSNFTVTGQWKAPFSTLTNMDARNDFLVVCGSTPGYMGLQSAPLAGVYDLRQLKALALIPFHAGAAFACLHPRLQTTSFVASQTGQMQVVDLMNPNTVNTLHHANVEHMVQMELAPSGEALAIMDHNSSILIWGSQSKIHFSKYKQETVFPDEPTTKTAQVDWDNSPLNAVGMPYYSDRLLSAWPSNLSFDIGAPPPQIDQSILPYMQHAEIGQGGPWPRKLFRYQVEDTRSSLLDSALAAPKFLSEKARETPRSRSKTGSRVSEATEALADATLNEKGEEDPILKYGNVEIKYSRFGVDDFDFLYYNKTTYSGLETHITNSYVNALLQLYRFTPLMRNLALHHTATNCAWEHCMLCELGFLVDMLEKANGGNCQATNLLRTFSASREASNLHLLEQYTSTISSTLSLTIQGANRFFLNQIAQDFAKIAGSTDRLDIVLNTAATESIRCMVCRTETSQPRKSYVNELVYPNSDVKGAGHNRAVKFSSILKASIERQSSSRGWCERCHRYQPQTFVRRNFQHVPDVMVINAAAPNPRLRHIWAAKGFLPKEIGILIMGDSMHIVEGFELEARKQENPSRVKVFELVGYVAEVKVADQDRPHLVSIIDTEISTPSTQASDRARGRPTSWHLFNDFLVAPLSEDEALSFPDSSSAFKIPSVIAYQIRSGHGAIDENWRGSLNTDLLYLDWSINGIPPQPSYKRLGDYVDHLTNNWPVALDTEFVELEPPIYETGSALRQGNSGGADLEVVRPSKTALARVSVLRGSPAPDGSDLLADPDSGFGIPFIDDYITTPESQIHDYKTQYSGIRPGDLDPSRSTHNLVPLKVAYKKLWLLVNLGCMFVGHGLGADFRKINLFVPKPQVRDTVYLFAKEGTSRWLSLRFLAWVVFSEFIQEEPVDGVVDGHDSVEDAMMALRLWRKWEEWDAKGQNLRKEMVEGIWRDGEMVRFKPPKRPGRGGGAGGGEAAGSGRNTPDPSGGVGKGFGNRLSAQGQVFVPGMNGSPLR